jgi:glycerol-3-phosphate acyltransferase PlsY
MIIQLIGISILAYFLGNFSPSYLVGKIFGNLDIREYGSGNAGTTNVIRVMGWRFGALVYVLDILKGYLAVSLGQAIGGPAGIMLAGFFVVIGHDYPVLLNFHGGKGIAATAGIALFLFPIPALFMGVLFLLIVLVTKMVSVGSISFVIILVAYSVISQQAGPIVLLTAGLAGFAFYSHKANIQRILAGKENKLSLSKKHETNTPTT